MRYPDAHRGSGRLSQALGVVFSVKRTKLEQLLDRLCTELGFCLAPEQQARFVASPPASIKAFTDAVFEAEGLDPSLADRHLWHQVRDYVSQYFNEFEPGGDDT